MTRNALQLLLAGFAMLVGSTSAFADTYTFAADPLSGNIQGLPGSTIGWGYSITNNSATDWLVTANLAANVFTNATPDASLFDFPTIAPGATASLLYDP